MRYPTSFGEGSGLRQAVPSHNRASGLDAEVVAQSVIFAEH